MENSPAFEDAVKFSARGILGGETGKPKDVETKKKTEDLFREIDPKEPTKSVDAIDKLIEMIGEDKSMTLDDVKALGKEIPVLIKKIEKDIDLADEEVAKYPLWARLVGGTLSTFDGSKFFKPKDKDINEVIENRDRERTLYKETYRLSDRKEGLKDKINEVILAESAKAVPEFGKVLTEEEKGASILLELDFLVSYTEGQRNYGTNLALGGGPRSVAEKFFAEARDASEAAAARKSLKRLNKLLGDQKADLANEKVFGAFDFLTSLSSKTGLFALSSSMGGGVALEREATAIKAKLVAIQEAHQKRQKEIFSQKKDLITNVRKDLGLPEYTGWEKRPRQFKKINHLTGEIENWSY